jgi:S-adenosylmethionine hydrolase
MKKYMTFTSDFGLSDSYVAEVKGVICALCADVSIIDLTHGIEPGNIRAASFVLAGSFRYFPRDTLHLVVVDPGVGTEREIIVVRCQECSFIGPDNGVLYEASARAGVLETRALVVDRLPAVLRRAFPDNGVVGTILERGVSSTFHGRDLFAPFTACMLAGTAVDGATVSKKTITGFSLPQPVRNGGHLKGEIVYVDRFGNLVSNIRDTDVNAGDEIFLKVGGEVQPIGRLQKTYAQTAAGSRIAVIGSRGYLEIAVNGGSARDLFNASYGDEIILLKKADKDG